MRFFSSRFFGAAFLGGWALCGTGHAAVPGCDTVHGTINGFDPVRLHAALFAFQTNSANLHGLVIKRHGAVVAECYRAGKDRSVYSLVNHTLEFDPSTRHDSRSISKSVTSLLWGIAESENKVPPLDAHVLDLMPELVGLKMAGRQDITIGHLLNMTSGLAWNESGGYGLGNPEQGLYWRSSQARYVFDRPMKDPAGQSFSYNGGGTAVLTAMLEKGVGMSLPDYARTRLFAPLGITDWEWLTDIRGRPLGFAGLRMRPNDLAKIGQLLLQHGRWNGKPIVPSTWIDASLQPRIAAGNGFQYGYHWWHGKTRAMGAEQAWTAAFGNGGQRLVVVPGLDLVVVVTAGMYNDEAGAIEVNKLFRQIVATVEQ